MLHTLYLLFIAPLEFLMRLVLEWGFSWTHSWGWSLVLLSLVVNTAILPLYNWAERCQGQERKKRRDMARHEVMLRQCFKGQERIALLTALHRLSGYNWLISLRASVVLLLQIPFFIAAYHLLSEFAPLYGQSFGPLADLSVPDALFSASGFRVNVLPFLMMVANLLAASVYGHNLSRRDKARIYGIALLFLALLYTAPSSLVLYWTVNNLYSLGKNVVTIYCDRRATYKEIHQHRQKRANQVIVEESLPHYWSRIFNMASFSLAISAFFWTYVCTFISLENHNTLLNIDYRNALWHSARQCFLTGTLAFAVCILLSIKSLFIYRLFPISLILLYLIQLKFSQGENDLSVFTLWNLNGTICFLFYIAGLLYCMKNARKTISQKNMPAFLAKILARIAAKQQQVVKGKNLEVRNSDSYLFACIVAAIFSIFLVYIVPFTSYFHNVNEFDFNAIELFWKLTPYLVWLFFMLTIFLSFFSYFLPFECISTPWRPRCNSGMKCNIMTTFILMLLFAAFFEGTFLTLGLPHIDGRHNLFASRERLFFDSIVWVIFCYTGFTHWRIIAKNIKMLLCIFTLFAISIFFDAYLNREVKIDINHFKKGIGNMQLVNMETFYSQLRFSNNNNVIVFLVDSLDTLGFEKTLERYPQFKSTFKGFVLFRENLGPGGGTREAVPQILAGKIYDEQVTRHPSKFNNFVHNALLGDNSMAADAYKHGYKVFIDADFWYVMQNDNDNPSVNIKHTRSIDNRFLARFRAIQLVFRYIPYYFKHVVESKINFMSANIDFYKNIIPGDTMNQKKFNLIISRMDILIDNAVFLFVHLPCVHPPYIQNDYIMTTKIFIENYIEFTKILKEKKCTIKVLSC